MRGAARAVAGAAALCLVLTGCTGAPSREPAPSASPADPVAAAVGAYLDAVDAELVAVMRDKGHLGVYVRPAPAWDLDRYVTQLPLAAETARDLLARFPEFGDVDLCADAPWLPRESGAAFVPATRVQLFRDRMSRVPARFDDPAQVLDHGLRQRTIDVYVEDRIRRESPAYREARRRPR